MFQTLVASGGSQWREGSGDGMWNVSLITHDSHAVRSLVTWMETPDGAAKRAAADAMLSAESVVAVARLAHYLEVQPMLSAAVHKIASALDAANAPSILLLARELHQTDLEEEATRFTIASLDAVEAEADYWSELPQATRETLKLLREATLRNPLLSAAGCSAAPISQTTMATSGKELLAMALADDAALRVPPGLEIDLPLDGVGQRRARIPPCWQLRVWVPQPLLGAFWRADLKRETFVAEINARASRALGVEVRLQYTAAVRGGGAGSEPPPPLDDVATAEEVGLWERQGSLQLVPLSQP